jgi:hypothetical protein
MGYQLEFYALPWDQLQKALIDQPTTLMNNVYENQWSSIDVPEGGSSNDVWLEGLRKLSTALHRSNSENTIVYPGDEGVLALVAIVRDLGFSLGELDHTSASGEFFRTGFLTDVAGKVLQDIDLSEKLTDRPILGLQPDVYPSWGGLSTVELDQIARWLEIASSEMEELDDESQIWLDELLPMLKEVASSKKDLFTLYL